MSDLSAGVLGRVEGLERRVAALEWALAGRAGWAEAKGEPETVTAEPVRPPVKVVAAPSVVAPPRVEAPVPAAEEAGEAWSWERVIGGRFYAAVGAVVVVVGVGMFLKLAVERGWFSFPPALRCLSAAGFGLLLLGAGEWARRRLGAAASVGLSAAGIATVWAAALAAFGLYKLVGPVPAFVLLAAASAMGVAVSLRARRALLAGLSLVAAYLTPLVLWRSPTSEWVMPVYLVALLGFGLWLSGWRPTPFRSVRTIVWWGTVLLGSAWGLNRAGGHALLVLVFLGAAWLAIHAELVAGAWRGPEVVGELSAAERRGRRKLRPVFASFATTVWVTLLGVGVANLARSGIRPPDWFAPAAAFGGACMVGIILAGTLRVLRDPPESDGQRLGIGLLMQAGGLLIVTVALASASWMQVACWLGLGVAAVGAGRWMVSRPLAVYGLTLLGIGIGRLVLWDSWHAPAGAAEVLGLHLTRWSLLVAVAGAAAAASAGLMLWRAEGGWWAVVGRGCVGAAWLLGFASVLHPDAAAASMGYACAAAGLGLIVSARALRSSGLVGLAIGFGAVCSMLVLLAHWNNIPGESRLLEVAGLVFAPLSGAAVMLAGVWIAAAWVSRGFGREWSEAAVRACTAAAVVMAFVVPKVMWSSEVGLCLLWSGLSLGLVVLHGWRARVGFDVMGLMGLSVAALAWAVWWPMGGTRGWAGGVGEGGFNPAFWVAVGWCASATAAALWMSRGPLAARARWRAGLAAAWGTVGVVLLVATSFELARVTQELRPRDATSQAAAVSIWWGVYAVALLAIGFAKGVPAVRHIGLGLLGVAVVKAVLFDLAEVPAEWRVASFIGLGLLMLGVAVVYARVTRLAAPSPRCAEGSCTPGASSGR